MRTHLPWMSAVALLAASGLSAKQVTEEYPGELLREEVLETKVLGRHLRVDFVGLQEGDLTFRIHGLEEQSVRYRPIHQKILISRQADDANDRGERFVVPGEVVATNPEQRNETLDMGPVADAEFDIRGTLFRTDGQGILRDRQQVLLAAFDDLRFEGLDVALHTDTFGEGRLVLTREQLRAAFDVHFRYRGQSHPDRLQAVAEWDRDQYAPGDIARLKLTVSNTGEQGDVLLVLGGRSISRWPWLDGKMFYLGKLPPGEQRVLSRRFTVPADAAAGRYYLRLGFNDYSGRKPQVPVSLAIRADTGS
jgi:hypothetical protein